jgi:hypothetical protein
MVRGRRPASSDSFHKGSDRVEVTRGGLLLWLWVLLTLVFGDQKIINGAGWLGEIELRRGRTCPLTLISSLASDGRTG